MFKSTVCAFLQIKHKPSRRDTDFAKIKKQAIGEQRQTNFHPPSFSISYFTSHFASDLCVFCFSINYLILLQRHTKTTKKHTATTTEDITTTTWKQKATEDNRPTKDGRSTAIRRTSLEVNQDKLILHSVSNWAMGSHKGEHEAIQLEW